MKKFSTIIAIFIAVSLSLISQTIHLPEMNKEEKEEYKFYQKKWLEEMHRTEPGVDYKIIDSELRNYLRDQRNKQREELFINDKFDQDKLQDVDIAYGRVFGKWYERGSNNQAGRTHLADIAPNGTDLYVASSGGNVWKGTLDGKNWKCLNNSYKFNSIDAFRVLDVNGKTRIFVFDNRNLYFSDNDGAFWQEAKGMDNLKNWGGISRGHILNDNGKNLIYVLADEWDYTNWKSKKVLYKSTDNGETFKVVTDYGNFSNIDCWGDIKQSNLLYIMKADSLFTLDKDEKLSFVAQSVDIYDLIQGGIDLKMTGNIFGDKTVIYFAIQYRGENKRYIIKYDSKSNTFSYRGEGPTNMFMRNSFEVSKINENLLWLGGVNCYTSANGGMTWNQINGWGEYYQDVENKLHADIPSIVTRKISDNEEIVFINTDGGTYRTYGTNYTIKNISMKGLNVSQFYSIYTHRGSSGEYLYAGSQDQGFQIGTADGQTVVGLEQVISGDYGSITSSNGGKTIWTVYPGFAMIFPYLPTNNTYKMWQFKGEYNDRVWMPPIVALPNNPDQALIAPGGTQSNSTVWRLEFDKSTNDIYTYEFPFNFDAEDEDNDVSALGISSINPSYYYALTKKGKFYTSIDGGNSWEVTDGFTGPGYNYLHGSAVLTSKNDLGTVYIAGSGYSNPGVYVTKDNGKTFDSVGTNAPKTYFYHLAATPDENFIFAATAQGPYIYLKFLNKWFNMAGLDAPEQVYWSVNYIPETKTARFATYGRGVWDFVMTKMLTDVEENSTTQSPVVNVSPTPATDYVNISIADVAQKRITARIFDIQGNMINEIYNGISNSEQLNLTWNLKDVSGHNTPAGQYILVYVIDGINNYKKISVIGK